MDPRWQTSQLRLNLDPWSASETTHPGAPWQFQDTAERPKSGWWPNSWKSPPVLQTSWNNPPTEPMKLPTHKSEPHCTLRPPPLPSAMAHILSVECPSLWIWVNPLLTYHFSHWILSVMRYQKSELHWVLKPGTTGSGWAWVPATWAQALGRISARFKSWLCGFESAATWVQVPEHGFKSRSEVNGFTGLSVVLGFLNGQS